MDPAPPPPTASPAAAPWWKTAAGWKGAVPWWFRHAKRAATVDYDRGVATDAERADLASPAAPGLRVVAARRMQDFLAWRRSMLSVATPLLFVYAVLHTIDTVRDLANEDLKRGFGENLPIHQLMETLKAGAAWVLAVACAIAASRWRDLPRSHRRLRLGWIIGFGVPVVLFFVPVGALYGGLEQLDFGEAPPQTKAILRDVVAMGLGLGGFLEAVPVAVAVFFGFLRAGFAVMRLSPESVVGGLAVSVGALLLALFLLPLMVVGIQAGSGNVLVILGALLFLAGLLRYVVAVTVLATPRGSGPLDPTVRSVRKTAVALMDGGMVLLLVFAFTFSLLGKHLLGFGSSALVGPYDLLKLAFEFAGRSIVTAALFCDVLSATAARAWGGSKSVHEGPMRALIEERVAELESVGVGELRRRKPQPAGTAS